MPSSDQRSIRVTESRTLSRNGATFYILPDPCQGVRSGTSFDRPPRRFVRCFGTRAGWTPTRTADGRISGTIESSEAYLSKRLKMIARVNPMNNLPVDRALSLYGTLADRSETKGARERLSRHLMQLYIGGEKDEHRLTVHGLSYLRDFDRAIDSRN
jgi:hypothetical protein